jgi:intron-binding protein aquarius
MILEENFSNLNFDDHGNFKQEEIIYLYRGLLEERNNKNILTKTLLSSLEKMKYLENILLPRIENKKHEISKEHIFSILIFINYKISLRVKIFDYIQQLNSEVFPKLFEKTIEYDLINQNDQERVIFIQFLINTYQSLEYKFINKSCLKLVSILLWVNLSKESIKNLLMENEKLIEKWKMLMQLSKKQNLVITKPCTFFNKLLEDFLKIIEIASHNENESNSNVEKLFIKFIEFLTDLLSQISTRKFLLPLLKEKHLFERSILVLEKLKLKNNSNYSNDFNEENHSSLKLSEKMLEYQKFYLDFEINEETGENLSPNIILAKHYKNLNLMQNVAFGLFPERLSRIYLKNISLIDNTENIKDMLDLLNEGELLKFAECLNLLKYKKEYYISKRDLVYQIFLSKYERKETVLEKINSLALYPDEKLIWDREMIPDDYKTNSNISEISLPVPKLNLQFLTHYDYLLRNFNLFRLESVYEIRSDLEDVISRMHAKFDHRGNFTEFEGWARMGVPVKSFKILAIKPALIGKNYPQEVFAEIEIEMKGAQTQIKNEWDKLKRHDVLFLLNLFKKNSGDGIIINDTTVPVKHTRGCEIVYIYDEENNEITDYEILNKKKPVGTRRRLHVHLDPVQYHQDLNEINVEEMYSCFQLLVRRKPEQNNFKAILDTIRDLMNSVTIIPNWLENIFLGYGDPNQAQYTKLKKLEKKIDFKDTFLDYKHFEENFLKNKNIPDEFKQNVIFNNNYISEQSLLNNSILNNFKKNQIEFTPKQIEAIHSGVNKGLTMIVGPPGTGKTDVAVQIVNLLYNNFPNQRTLIVTHSNHALNDIFEKITNLNIDERYLLRLGMGERDLSKNIDKDFSKNGRVNYMLNRRIELLNLVLKFAHSLNVFTFEEYTCEHAINLYEHGGVKEKIQKFRNEIINKNRSFSFDNLLEIFPFKNFFNVDISNSSKKIEIFEEYLAFIDSIFSEIQDLRAFELLRNNYERGNHLLVRGSKIIAMTCTHAALKRKEFIKLGFEYDNIIMEEAAQILEVETFIPMLLQNSNGMESKLKRVVLIGDNNQLPPIIKSNAFKMYGNMDQSMFSRFIRMDVPYVLLDMQGRTRYDIISHFFNFFLFFLFFPIFNFINKNKFNFLDHQLLTYTAGTIKTSMISLLLFLINFN